LNVVLYRLSKYIRIRRNRIKLRYMKNLSANTMMYYTHECAAEHVSGRMRMEYPWMLGKTDRVPQINCAEVSTFQ
jgi:hypothetical protein